MRPRVDDSCLKSGVLARAQVSPLLRIVITRSVALLPTLLVVFVTSTPNKLDVLNQWLNILQSVQLVFAVLPVSRETA